MAGIRYTTRRQRQAGRLTPAAQLYLTIGEFPSDDHRAGFDEPEPTSACLPGWFELHRTVYPSGAVLAQDEPLRATWELHREALTAEAEAYGFTAAGTMWFDRGQTDMVPDVAKVRAWRRAFLARVRR
jgi:hypothetical protein